MNQERYPFLSNDNHLTFEFDSDGPNGKIRKVITFGLYNADGESYFNVAFGHWNEEANDLDDTAISNNRDRAKILATVAAAVIEVNKFYPDMPIAARGSNPARTRLYQMGISANLNEIESRFNIYGWNKGQWEQFTRNVNYEAFLVKRKME